LQTERHPSDKRLGLLDWRQLQFAPNVIICNKLLNPNADTQILGRIGAF